MSTMIEEKKAVLNFVYNFKDAIKKGDWVSRYDLDTDSFSITTKKLPDDARIKYFGNEFAFYITKDKQVKGVFIEYFKKNFVKHNKEVRDIEELLVRMEKVKKPNEALLEIKKNQLKQSMISELEEAMEGSLAEAMELSPAK